MQAPLVEANQGWDFKVLILEDEWVLRIARNAGAAAKIAKEAALLPALAPALRVRIPRFEQVSERPAFVVYPLIRGEPLEDEDTAGVRAFLAALHAFDASGLDVPASDWLEAWQANAEIFRALVLPRLDPDERAAGETLLREVETLTDFEPALTHCDLGPEHLLIRRGRLAGVIDWADAQIGDPAIDYAWLLNVAFPDWEVAEDVRRRALIYHRLGPWFEVEYGVRTDQPDFVRSGLAGVRSRL